MVATSIALAAPHARAVDARRFLYVQPLGDELAGEVTREREGQQQTAKLAVKRTQ